MTTATNLGTAKTEYATLPDQIRWDIKELPGGRDGSTWTYVIFDTSISKIFKANEHLREFFSVSTGLQWHSKYSRIATQGEKERHLQKTGDVDKSITVSVYFLPRVEKTMHDTLKETFWTYKRKFAAPVEIEEDEVESEEEEEDDIESVFSAGFSSAETEEEEEEVEDSKSNLPFWVTDSADRTLKSLRTNIESWVKEKAFTLAMLERIIENEADHKLKNGTVKPRSSFLAYLDNLRETEFATSEEEEDEGEEVESEEVEVKSDDSASEFYNPNEFTKKELQLWLETQDGKLKPSDISQLHTIWTDKKIPFSLTEKIGMLHAAKKTEETATKFVTPTAKPNDDKIDLLVSMMGQMAQILAELKK